MKRAPTLLLLWASFSLAQQPQREPALPEFHAQTDLVMVPFQVSRGKQFASDLKPADIVLLEDGAPRAFTVFEGPQDHAAVELVLLFDTTTWPMGGNWHAKAIYESLTNRWEEAMSQAVLQKGVDEVRASVYHFDGVRLERLCRSTTGPNQLLNALQNLLAPIHSSDLTPSQRHGIDVAIGAASTRGAHDPALDQLFGPNDQTPASGAPIPLELPANREVLPPEAWPGTGHRGWPLEAAIGTLKDSAAAPEKAIRMLVMFSEGVGGTTTVPEDVADEAVALGIPVYPVVVSPGATTPGPLGGRGGNQEREAFAELGGLTGGRRFEASDDILSAGNVCDILEIVRNEGLARAHSQYNVGFAQTPSSGAPRAHKLEIKLASKSSGKLIGGKRRVIY